MARYIVEIPGLSSRMEYKTIEDAWRRAKNSPYGARKSRIYTEHKDNKTFFKQLGHTIAIVIKVD